MNYLRLTIIELSGTDAGMWVTGSGGRAIFSWDEGIFRNALVTGAINNGQERFLHNLWLMS